MMKSPLARVAVVVLILLCSHASAGAQPADAKGLALFESKIRPVLIKECYSCHSAEAAKTKKLRGGLQLDTREGNRKGGDAARPSFRAARQIDKSGQTKPDQPRRRTRPQDRVEAVSQV